VLTFPLNHAVHPLCTALKATGLLSCLQMKIVSFRMKLKWMWCLREVQLEILGVVLALLRWTMLLHEESACQLCGLLWLHCTTTARVNKETEQNVFCCYNGLKDTAVTTCRPASADDGCVVMDSILRDLLCCLWRVGLVATSPMRWEACLSWMSHDPVSPVWWCSVRSQL